VAARELKERNRCFAESWQATSFSERIPAADPEKYKFIRDARDRANPYLIVDPNSILVRALTLPPGGKTVRLERLRETLMDLPLSAWPHGRVVAVGPHYGVGGRVDPTSINANMRATMAVLTALPVVVNPWPR
jgi:hypothetical protein